MVKLELLMPDLKILNYKSRCIITIITIKQDEEIEKPSEKWMVFQKKLLLKEHSIIIFKKPGILFTKAENTWENCQAPINKPRQEAHTQ